MKNYLIVGLGGALGSLLRYACSSFFLRQFPDVKFPWGTFFVNLLGCLLIGLVAGFIEKLSNYNAEFRLLLITGFLGGFTTFSAFGLETVSLLKTGHSGLGLLYAFSSLLLGGALVLLGLKLSL